MKTRTLLIAAVMMMALSAAAFAQATFQVGSSPVTAVIKTGYAELTGAVTFTGLSGTTINPAGTITISYGAAIVNTLTNANITGTLGATYNSQTSNSVIINVPANVAATGLTVTVSGVRVTVYGTGITSLNASITATGNAIVAGQTNVLVINSVADGIASVAVSTAVTLNGVTGALTPVGPPAGQGNIRIKEGFQNAFVTGLGVRLTVDKPAANVKITFPATAGTTDNSNAPVGAANWTRGDKAGVASATTLDVTSSSTAPIYVYYYLQTAAGAAADTTIENLNITATVTTTALPVVPSTVTVTAILAPQASDLAANTTYVPRFGPPDVTPANVTVLTVFQATTALLIPYVTVQPGYDTGIAIANTTEDPGATALGITTAASAQSGTIIFYFFPAGSPSTSGPWKYTTDGTVGAGMDTTGVVSSGSTYNTAVSQMLPKLVKVSDGSAAAQTTFTGYIIAVTNFTNAHGLFTLYNVSFTYSQGGIMNVIDVNRQSYPEKIVN